MGSVIDWRREFGINRSFSSIFWAKTDSFWSLEFSVNTGFDRVLSGEKGEKWKFRSFEFGV